MQSRENKKEKIIRTDENKIDKTATMTCGHAKALEEFGDRGNSQIKLGTMPRSCYLIVQGIDYAEDAKGENVVQIIGFDLAKQVWSIRLSQHQRERVPRA
jgi:hypothetical protein